ncbi:MAG: hypothetical protein ACTHJ4_02495 [Candidatus Nucleicultricaceae bacterium]
MIKPLKSSFLYTSSFFVLMMSCQNLHATRFNDENEKNSPQVSHHVGSVSSKTKDKGKEKVTVEMIDCEEPEAGSASQSSSVGEVSFDLLPGEVTRRILQCMSIREQGMSCIQVSRVWETWARDVRQETVAQIRQHHQNFDSFSGKLEDDQTLYKKQMLRAHLFSLDDPEQIQTLMIKHGLYQSPSFFDPMLPKNFVLSTVYDLPPEQRIPYIETLAALGIEQGEEVFFDAIVFGQFGVQSRPKGAYLLNQKLIKAGSARARKRLHSWYFLTRSVDQHPMRFLQNASYALEGMWVGDNALEDERLYKLIRDSAEKTGDYTEVLSIINQMAQCGNFSHYESIEMIGTDHVSATHSFNDIFMQYRYRPALEYYVNGSMNGTHGYVRNEEAARDYINLLSDEGDPYGVETKYFGLLTGTTGFREDKKASIAFLDHWVALDHSKAITLKFEALVTGDDEYEQDIKAAVALNDAAVLKGDKAAIQRKFKGLLKGYDYEGVRPYEENLDEAIRFACERALSPTMTMQDIKHLLALVTDEVMRDRGDFSPIQTTIEQLHQNGNILGSYLKALATKFGILGFDKDPVALQNILSHKHIG